MVHNALYYNGKYLLVIRCSKKIPIDRSTSSDALRKACRATRPRISSANYLIKRRSLDVGSHRHYSFVCTCMCACGRTYGRSFTSSKRYCTEVARSRNTIKRNALFPVSSLYSDTWPRQLDNRTARLRAADARALICHS